MPQVVETKDTAWSAAILLSQHIFVMVLLACSCTGGLLRAAEDEEEIPAEKTVNTVADGQPLKPSLDPAKKTKSALEELANDPVLGLFSKIKAQPEDELRAIVIDVGAETEFLPRSNGRWSLALEEEGPVFRTEPRAPQPGDPEYQPPQPLDEDEKAAELAAAKTNAPRKAVIKASDPEARAIANLDDGTEAKIEKTDVASKSPARVALDIPRFASGSGLDSDAAEVVSQLANAKDAETGTNAEAVAAPDAATNSKTELIAKLKALAENMPELPKTLKPGDKKHKKGKEPVDPQKHYEDMIAQLEKNIDTLNEKAKAAGPDKTVAAADGEEIRVRDARAAKAMQVLLNNTPLGTIQGAIGDTTLKHYTAARVRITDVTDTAIDAPLPIGFWTTGPFNVQAVSGLVNIEVNGGRFRAPVVKTLQVKPQAATAFEAALIKPAALNFGSRGWYLADLEMPLRTQPGERALWMGNRPEMKDLLLAAHAEGVQILGVPLPTDDPELAKSIENTVSKEVLVLPVMPGPRHIFYGSAIGLGVGAAALNDIPRELTKPEVPLHEAFEEIHARGGLAVFTNVGGLKNADIKRDIFPIFPRLQQSNYFGTGTTTRLYAANELMFDTIAGPAYDAISFDGSPVAETLWFNLLNQGYSVSVIGASGRSLEAGRIPYGQTFIKIDGAPTREAVLDSIKQGKTCVSFGPAAFCKVIERDKGPGATVPADGRRLTLQVEAYASMLPGAQLDTIEIIRNGKVVHIHKAADGEAQINNLSWPVAETASAWYVVRVTERLNTGNTTSKGGMAWTGAIYFRGAAYAPPAPATSKITGVLRRNFNPVAGTITAVVPGQAPKQVATDANGRFTVQLAASGALIFEAPGCEPVARRVFEHPKVQQALGAVASERDGRLIDQFAKPALFPSWRLLVSELEWNIDLSPAP